MSDDLRGNVTVVSTPKPRHRCDLPGQPWNQHWERVGTVVACEECGQHWISERHPRVVSGSQMVGNRWVKTRKPKAPRQRTADDAEDVSGNDPPLVLAACALLWIGIAIGLYLPSIWVNIAMTAIAVVAIVAYVMWRIRRRRAT